MSGQAWYTQCEWCGLPTCHKKEKRELSKFHKRLTLVVWQIFKKTNPVFPFYQHNHEYFFLSLECPSFMEVTSQIVQFLWKSPFRLSKLYGGHSSDCPSYMEVTPQIVQVVWKSLLRLSKLYGSYSWYCPSSMEVTLQIVQVVWKLLLRLSTFYGGHPFRVSKFYGSYSSDCLQWKWKVQ